MALTTNLVSYWKLDEASGNAADSVGTNTLTNNGTLTYGTGIINNGAIPSTTGPKFLSITNAAQTGLSITGDMSFQFWANTSTQPALDGATGGIASKFSAVGYLIVYAQETSGGAQYKLQMQALDTAVNTTGYFYNGATPILTTSSWVHVVMTFTAATKIIHIYVNNVDKAITYSSQTATSIGTNAADFTLGQCNGTGNEYNGTIDEVGIWSRVLTSTEVGQLYNSGAGLAYPFGEGGTGATIRRMMRGIGS